MHFPMERNAVLFGVVCGYAFYFHVNNSNAEATFV